MEDKEFKISEKHLEELLSYIGRSLTGKLMKRFEIIENKDILKSETKELVYEEIRHLRDLIESHQFGLNLRIFKMKETV